MKGYNYCLKKGQLPQIDRKLLQDKITAMGLDCPTTDYGIFYKSEDYDKFDMLLVQCATEQGIQLERQNKLDIIKGN